MGPKLNWKIAALAVVATVLASVGFLYLPRPAGCDLTSKSAFRTNPYGAAAPFQNGSYYVFEFAPTITPPYTIAGADAISEQSCHIRSVQFGAKFVTNGNHPLGSDDMVVFFADNITSFKGQEFGVRFIAKSGIIFGYVQDGPKYFTQVQLISNDGDLHRYSINISRDGTNDIFTWSVDDVVKGSLTHPSTYDYTELLYWTVMTTHRLSNGWDSTGDYMQAGDFQVLA